MRVAVIGRGLIGSAAARHLAKAGHEVLLIGPSEPSNKRAHRGVFASHYDEGRITRRMATHPFWAQVSSASIDRYAEIAREAGIDFFTEAGAMMAGATGGAFIEAAKSVRAAADQGSIAMDRAALAGRFPWFAFPQDFEAIYERTGAGHISPRRLVAAQTEAARRHGAAIVDAIVTGVEEGPRGPTVKAGGDQHQVDEVLVATGGMTDHVLPAPLGLTVKARTVTFFRIDEAEAARLSGMPSLVFRWDDRSEPYLLPPIRYPDGNIYLKLGGDPVDVPLASPDEIGDWFRSGGNPAVRDYLVDMMGGLIPDLQITGTHMEPCITTYTGHGLPVICRVGRRVSVATAGNGAGAKCSDELGRLGALTVLGKPPAGLGPTPEGAMA